MLYLAELLKQNQDLRFGYADDLCLYRASPSFDTNVSLLAKDVASVLKWGDDNKVLFAPEKCELQHITRSIKDTSNPSVIVGNRLTIHPVSEAEDSDKEPALRWLGVYFDRNLSFRRHVAERAGKAMALAHHIRGLANTVNGPLAAGLRKAVITCVIPTALYGYEAWYAGREKPPENPSQAGKDLVSAKVGWHVHEVQRALALAARAVLPVWRTTPTSTIFRDAGLPTAQIALDEALHRFAFRLRSVDRKHPLAGRTDLEPIVRGRGAGGYQRPKTKVQRVARMLPLAQRPLLVAPRYPPGSRKDPTEGMTKEDAAKAFIEWQAALPARDVVIFTDGSQLETAVGYGFAIYADGTLKATGKGKLSPTSIVFDAEVVGAWKGLQHVTLEFPELMDRRIWVCLDNTGAIWGLRGNPSGSTQWAYLRFHAVADKHDVRVKWCPGHCDIPGNELADQLAKEGTKLHEPDQDCTPTLYGIKSIGRKHMAAKRESWWEGAKLRLSRRYNDWNLGYKIRSPEELHVLSRPELHRYLAIRTGHGDFAWYHVKFKHDDAQLDCSCGRPKDPLHLARCTKLRERYLLWPEPRPKRRPNGRQASKYLHKMMAKPTLFRDFLQATDFYGAICARGRLAATPSPTPSPSL